MSTKFVPNRLLPFTIVLLILVSYSQLYMNDFVNYDDPGYVVENIHLIASGITPYIWALTATYASNWHPLTWWVHIINTRMFGLDPIGHHSISLLLHTANALLLFSFLRLTTKKEYASLFVTLLFALHPLHVESVAWAAELKDVLCAFFWLLTMVVYCFYAQKPTSGRYAMVLISFIFGLSAKPMIVTLPFALLLLDYWPLGRLCFPQARYGLETNAHCKPLRMLLREKIPLFILSIGASVITVSAQKTGGALNSYEQASITQCLGNALISYAGYLKKLFWPTNLAVVYPFDSTSITFKSTAIATLVLLIISIVAVYSLKKQPYLLIGWLWYVGTLVPVIGLIRVGHHSMADRYSYIPLIGIFIMVVWGINDLTMKFTRRKRLVVATAGTLLPILMVLTWIQVGYWRNSFTLFTHAVQATDNNWMAYNNLGTAILRNGDAAQALGYFEESIRIWPKYSDSHNNLGTAYEKFGKNALAIMEFQTALSLNPNNPDAHFNVGLAYNLAGETDKAMAESHVLQGLNDPRAQELMDVIAGKRLIK